MALIPSRLVVVAKPSPGGGVSAVWAAYPSTPTRPEIGSLWDGGTTRESASLPNLRAPDPRPRQVSPPSTAPVHERLSAVQPGGAGLARPGSPRWKQLCEGGIPWVRTPIRRSGRQNRQSQRRRQTGSYVLEESRYSVDSLRNLPGHCGACRPQC